MRRHAITCDQCRKTSEVSEVSEDDGWRHLVPIVTGAAVRMIEGTGLDLCSWACVAEYAKLQALFAENKP